MSDGTLQERLAELWRRSAPEMERRAETVEDAVLALVDGALDEGTRAAAEREAHRLAGTLGTFGLSAGSAAARELELLLAAPPEDVAAQARMAELAEGLSDAVRGGPATGDVAATDPAPAGPAVLLVDSDPTRVRALVAAGRARGLSFEAVGGLEGARAAAAHRRFAAGLVVLRGEGLPPGAVAELEMLAVQLPDLPVEVAGRSLTTADRLALARAGVTGVADAAHAPSLLVDAVRGRIPGLRTDAATVLVVDDDETMLAALADLLGPTELRIATLADPLRLWEVLPTVDPDLVVLDVRMPEVDGFALCRLLRSDERWGRVPVVVVSGALDATAIAQAYEAGADDFLTKQMVGPAMVARIRHRIERVRLHQRALRTDVLTGLPNRHALTNEFGPLAAAARDAAVPMAVVLVDIDTLRTLNMSLGHVVGDEVIQHVAAELGRAAPPEALLARLGGGEFLLVLPRATAEEARTLVSPVVDRLAEDGLVTAGHRVSVPVSAGVVELGPDVDWSIDGVYWAADTAVLKAKARGGARVFVSGADLAGAAVAGSVDVLVVDDDVVVVDLLRSAMEAAGYRTAVLMDGADALARLTAREDRITARCVLLDVGLPSLTGPEVLRGLAAAGVLATTDVIVVSARSGERDVTEALELGAVDHVAKPFSVPVIVQRVRRRLGDPR